MSTDPVRYPVEDLAFSKRLENHWGVVVMGWAAQLETRYSLQPQVEAAKPLNLESLQSDLKVIADDLCRGMQTRAQALLKAQLTSG